MPRVHLLTLWAPLATVVVREAARADRARLGARVVDCWRELEANLGELGSVVDATGPVDEIVARARGHIEAGALAAA
jgi:hypothetical protein